MVKRNLSQVLLLNYFLMKCLKGQKAQSTLIFIENLINYFINQHCHFGYMKKDLYTKYEKTTNAVYGNHVRINYTDKKMIYWKNPRVMSN